MANDPFAAFGGHEVTSTQTSGTTNTSDPFAAFGGQVLASAPTTQPTSTPEQDPFAAFGGRSVSNPDNGQTQSEPPQHLYQDSSQPLYRRAWDWANTPLTESLFGLPEDRPGAGGFERGVEHIASGLTAPLSLALTAATLGGGGLVESAGATALKESGEFAAEEIPSIIRGAQAAVQAGKDLAPGETAVADAIKATGLDPARFKTAQDVLWKNGLSESDLIGGSNLQNGAFQIIRHVVPDMPIASAQLASKTANAIMNAGFTYQQLESAAAMSPRFLDSLKEGDYDKALEYGTEALASGALGVVGAGHAIKSWGELTEPLLTTKLRPSDTTVAVQRVFGDKEAEHAVAEQTAIDISKKAKELLGHDNARPILGDPEEVKTAKAQDLATTELGVHTGMDAAKAAEWHDALAEAAGKDERVRPLSGQSPDPDQVLVDRIKGLSGEEFDQLSDKQVEDYALAKKRLTEARVAAGEPKGDHAWNDSKEPYRVHLVGDLQYISKPLEDGLIAVRVLRGNDVLGTVELAQDRPGMAFSTSPRVPENLRGQGIAKGLYEQLPTIAKSYGIHTITGEGAQTEGGVGIWKSLERDGKARPIDMSEFGEKPRLGMTTEDAPDTHKINNWRTTEQRAADARAPFGASATPTRPVNGQDPLLADKIANNKFKDQTPEYQNRVLSALKSIATGDVPDNVKSAIDYLRSEQAKSAEIGGDTGLIKNFVDNHMRRVWKDTNPEGKVISSEAKAGRFATSVSQARQRVYDSTLTGLLKSPKEMEMDPVDSTAEDRANLLKAAANKKFIETIMDKGFKDSTGRPVAFLSGSGRVVSGPNGEDPSIFIKPGQMNVRSLKIGDPEIAKMTQSGDLERFLDDGTIKDKTPYVRPDNIRGAIARLEEQADRKDATYDAVGNNKLRNDVMLLKSMLNNQDFSGLKAFNEAQPKVYSWDPAGYVSLANGAVKGWNFVTNSPDGTPVYVHSDVQVSPEYAEYIKNRLGLEEGALSKNPVGKAILGTGRALKETLLSLSPFHLTQIMLRAVMTGSNPFTLEGPDIIHGAKVDPLDPNSPTKIRKMIEQGYTTGTDYKGQQSYTEGVSSGDLSLLRKIPGIGPLAANAQKFWTDFLFKRALPAIKATAAEKMFDVYRAKYPDWSVDKVARAAGQHANDSFGGVNWKAMGRNATTQQFASALLLAPDWLESELRSGARLFNKDEGGIGREQVLKMAGSVYLLARVLNKVTTGNYHPEAPFSLATKSRDGKETLWSIRILPTDLLSAASNPVSFIKGRLSPTLHTAQELVTQRDNYGRKLGPEDLWADVIRGAVPIPIQSIGQAVTNTGPEVGNIGQTWKALGGTARNYSTPAAQAAADLAASHSEDGPIDPAQMHRHRVVMDLESKVRSGEMSYPDLMKLAYQTDQLSEVELKHIQQNLQKTKGMDSTLASLYTRASRLPAAQYLSVYDQMNPTEKAALVPLTLQVQRRYLTKAKKEMTPEERQRDPVFQRLLNMTPQPPITQQ